MPFSVDDRLWTVAEAAEYLNCVEETVRRMIVRGDLKAFKVARTIRLNPLDVKRAAKPIKVYTPSSKAGGDVA